MLSQKVRILKAVLGDFRKEGSEHLYHCPKCNSEKKKLSINIKKDVWKCWICGYSGGKLYRLVRKYGTNLNLEEWRKFSSEDIPDNFVEYFKTLFDEEEPEEIRVSLPEEFKSLTNLRDKSYEASRARDYLYSRGLTFQDILRWKIGYASKGNYAGRVIVPSFNKKGHCNFFVSRSYGNHFHKYKNSKVSKKEIIFNELYLDWSKDLVIVEGVFDAIVAGNAVPALGKSLSSDSKLFQTIVTHDTPIYMALDRDAEYHSLRAIEELLKYEIQIFKIDTSYFEDVGSITKEQFKKAKENAIPVDEKAFLLLKLGMIS